MLTKTVQRPFETLALAFFYIVTAKIGFLLAIPPGNVTILWPPSGLAFAAILILGYRAAFGIFLGSFVVNTWFFHDLAMISNREIVVVASIATGSTLQAVLGKVLLQRFISTMPLLEHVGDILKFILLTMLICVVASVFGATSLCVAGFSQWENYFYTWWTWWMGDVSGVLVVTPAILMLWGKSSRKAPTEMALFPILGLGIGLSLIAFYIVWNLEAQKMAALIHTGGHWQSFIVLLSGILFTGLLVGYVASRHESQKALERFAAELEKRVAERTEQIKIYASDLEQANRSLASSNEALEQFAFVASHDLQEPLRKIVSFTMLLSRRLQGGLDEDLRQYMDILVDSSKRLQKLIQDILQFSRSGRVEQRFEDVDVNEIMAKVVSTLELSIREKQAKIMYSDLPIVRTSPALLEQVLQNLLSNSLKFVKMAVVPAVNVSATPSGNKWLFSVKDNGIGVEAVFLKKVFVIFQRLNAASDYPGTGMGLAICKKLVEGLGGEIWMESKLGEGTTVYFSLPQIPNHREADRHAGNAEFQK